MPGFLSYDRHHLVCAMCMLGRLAAHDPGPGGITVGQSVRRQRLSESTPFSLGQSNQVIFLLAHIWRSSYVWVNYYLCLLDMNIHTLGLAFHWHGMKVGDSCMVDRSGQSRNPDFSTSTLTLQWPLKIRFKDIDFPCGETNVSHRNIHAWSSLYPRDHSRQWKGYIACTCITCAHGKLA